MKIRFQLNFLPASFTVSSYCRIFRGPVPSAGNSEPVARAGSRQTKMVMVAWRNAFASIFAIIYSCLFVRLIYWNLNESAQLGRLALNATEYFWAPPLPPLSKQFP